MYIVRHKEMEPDVKTQLKLKQDFAGCWCSSSQFVLRVTTNIVAPGKNHLDMNREEQAQDKYHQDTD